MPEYRAVRETAGGFLNMCYTPKLAAEVTLQPIRRFGFDAAILFADILVVPDALGHIAAALAKIPIKTMVLDAELTALTLASAMDFRGLLRKKSDNLCVWLFDMLAYKGNDLRPFPLAIRRFKLEKLMVRVENSTIRYSETFTDPLPLLAACAANGQEGIVSKRIDQPYRSGARKEWLKIKGPEWRRENEWRNEFFQKR